MPRVCTICSHSERQAIDRALVAGESVSKIAALFRVSADAVARHRAHIPAQLAKAQAAQETADAIDIMAELKRSLGRVNLLFDACDRWLRDADDPTQYDIGPRAHDVLVAYTEQQDGRPMRKKARLSILLDQTGVDVESAETKYTDPRLLLLRTSAQLQSNLELIAKLIGQLDDRPVTNILIAPEWRRLRTVLLEALQPYTDARIAVAEAIRGLDAGE
jgi:hypothetical protein